MNMTTRIENITWLSCVLAGMAVAPTFAYASFTPFTYVRVELDRENLFPDPDGSGYLNCEFLPVGCDYTSFGRSDSSDFAQLGSSPYFAKARASFGETGSFAMVTGQPLDYHAHAESMWGDAFTIFGGTGTGVLSVSVQVEGSLTGAGANSIYALFAGDIPLTLGDESLGTGLLGFAGGNYPAPPGSRAVIGVYNRSLAQTFILPMFLSPMGQPFTLPATSAQRYGFQGMVSPTFSVRHVLVQPHPMVLS